MSLRPAGLLALLALAACARGMPPAASAPTLDALFAPPTPAEIAEVEAEWAGRDTGVHGFRVESTRRDGATGRTLVVSHTVGGVRHFGAVRVPDGAGPGKLPVLVVLHGGDAGATGYRFNHSGPLAREWIQVLPSLRGEPLWLSPLRRYRSAGSPSPWDRDVDDAMALLSAVLAHVPEADSARVAAVGESRGGGVALLMGIRDPRVKAVVDYVGPTDFLLPEVRALALRAVSSRIPRLPGAGFLADSVLFALRDGRTTVRRARLELIRRSPVYFAHRLPPTQAHYGARDRKVAVAHGDRLNAAVARRDTAAWQYHRYPTGRHRVSSLAGARARAAAFLSRVAGTHPSSRVP